MIRNRTASPLPRTVLGLLCLLGLTAVITGVLAMHVWMGGHGSTHHHDATTSATSAELHVHAAGQMPGSVAMMPAVDADHLPSGCAGDCADEIVVGLCVLAMIVVGLAAIPDPAGRGLARTLSRRGPPAASWGSRYLPGPSLTHLCISRT